MEFSESQLAECLVLGSLWITLESQLGSIPSLSALLQITYSLQNSNRQMWIGWIKNSLSLQNSNRQMEIGLTFQQDWQKSFKSHESIKLKLRWMMTQVDWWLKLNDDKADWWWKSIDDWGRWIFFLIRDSYFSIHPLQKGLMSCITHHKSQSWCFSLVQSLFL